MDNLINIRTENEEKKINLENEKIKNRNLRTTLKKSLYY